jgi:uncharacterized repeat protein (TIGR03803 family)
MSSKRFLAAVASAPARLVSIAVLGAVPLAAGATPATSTVVAFSGSVPVGNLVAGADGALYGAAAASTSVTGGLIYRIAADGSAVATLYQLRAQDDGQTPQAGLLLASDGKFYGTTKFGKSGTFDTTGTIFRINQDGTGFTVLHRFSPFTGSNVASAPKNADGAYPSAELIEGSDGNLYGVTGAGGPEGTGAIFKLSKDGTSFQTLHTFSAITTTATDALVKNAEGMSLAGPLVQGTDGKFYGTASAGGIEGRGTIFRINFDGTGFQVIHTFSATTADTTSGLITNADGALPTAGLIDGGDGLLYGMTSQAGTKGYGTIFAISPDGATFTNLHDFDNTGGARPAAELALFSDGKLYGATVAGGTGAADAATNFGTLFSIARDGTGFTKLYSLDGSVTGSGASSQLLQLSSTVFVGAASSGGACGSGTIFRYDSTGGTVVGNTKCGRKKNSGYGGGGGATEPAVLLLLGGLALARRRRR